MGPLHSPVTWYKITHAGTRVAQWGRVKVDWNELLCFGLHVLYHVIGSCKGLLIGRSSTVHTSVLHPSGWSIVGIFFLFLHSVALESHVEAFQYKMLSNILYTNNRTDNVRCTFCEAKPETLYRVPCQYPYSRHFWNDFESYWCLLFGITSLCNVLQLNYFIIVGKLFLLDSRRKQIHLKIKR